MRMAFMMARALAEPWAFHNISIQTEQRGARRTRQDPSAA